MGNAIFTIGHSTHAQQRFLELLALHRIDALADVRSTPYSRYNPQFNREALRDALRAVGLSYVYLGQALSAAAADADCLVDGQPSYRLVARTPAFRTGLARVLAGSQEHRIALMCAEKDPLDCHRTVLVARALERAGGEVVHILADGSLESQAQAVLRLLRRWAPERPERELFGEGAQVGAAEVWARQEALLRRDGRRGGD